MAPLADIKGHGVRILGAAAESLLAGSVPARALPFAREIAVQTAFPLGAVRASDDAETAAVRAVVKLLKSAADGSADLSFATPASGRDARFVAAVFQNLDLLYDSEFPHADAVAAAVLQAVWPEDREQVADRSDNGTDLHDTGSPR